MPQPSPLPTQSVTEMQIDTHTAATPAHETAAKPDSRQEIVSAAAQCFMRQGLDKSTIDDIAATLGATKGRVYHHFRSKSAIYFAVYRQAMQYCFDAIDPLMDLPIPAAEKLVRMAEAHAHVMMDTLPYQRSIRLGVDVYLRGSTTETERQVLVQLIDMRNRYEGRFRRVLEQGRDDGTLSVRDVPLAGRAIIGALNGLVDWYRVRADQAPDEQAKIARTLAETIVGGVRA